MSTHTPGPWWIEYRVEAGTGASRVIIMGDAAIPREVASFRREVDDDEARIAEDADARLIAAAPDLLAAVRRVWEAHVYKAPAETRTAALEACEAALAKAEGREDAGRTGGKAS